MEIDKLFGNPAHPLLVHLPVVLLPIAAVAAVLVALVPSWRRRYGNMVLGLSFVALLSTLLAYGSGEKLERRIDPSDAVQAHIDLAEVTRPIVVGFFVAVAGLVVGGRFLDRRPEGGGRAPGTAMAAVTVVAAVAATVWMARTGHAGGTAVWRGVANQLVNP